MRSFRGRFCLLVGDEGRKGHTFPCCPSGELAPVHHPQVFERAACRRWPVQLTPSLFCPRLGTGADTCRHHHLEEGSWAAGQPTRRGGRPSADILCLRAADLLWHRPGGAYFPSGYPAGPSTRLGTYPGTPVALRTYSAWVSK